MNENNSFQKFGNFGGQYVPELFMPILIELEEKFTEMQNNKDFLLELKQLQKEYIGRPTPLYFAKNLSEYFGTGKIYFKRDELNFTGSHKINNAIGQVLLAKYMGKTRIVAETGAGQHGVATATACAKLGMECVIYMGGKDVERQKPNLFKMEILGAKVISVETGNRTLKEAMNESMKDWSRNIDNTYFCIGTAAGAHPYPSIVKYFQSVIGQEARDSILEIENCLPRALLACIGGGSNAIGLFSAFLNDSSISLYGIEANGPRNDDNLTAAAINHGRAGVLHGFRSYFLQNDEGQILESSSISAGLDYPGIGPEHAYLHDSGRVNYVSVYNEDALDAFLLCSKLEGIIPALEPSHALAYLKYLMPDMNSTDVVIVNLCGRGDKDMHSVMNLLEGRDSFVV